MFINSGLIVFNYNPVNVTKSCNVKSPELKSMVGFSILIKCGKVFGAPKGISKKNQQKTVICEQYFRESILTVNEIYDLKFRGLD